MSYSINMTSETVRHRKPHPSSNSPSCSPAQKFQDELERIKEEVLASGFTQDDFNSCLNIAAKLAKVKLQDKPKNSPTCCSRVSLCFKVLWIGLLLSLAFALASIAYSPLMFYMHKVK